MLNVFNKTELLTIRSFSKDRSCQIAFIVLGLALAISMSAFGQFLEQPLDQSSESSLVRPSQKFLEQPSEEYTVSPGDSLYISVWGMEALSGTATIGPDGTIMLPQPIGNVYVDRMKVAEITALLTRRLEEFIKDPVVSVSIRELHEYLVHIMGHVNAPSFYLVPEGTSIQELITNAGGFTELADPSEIILIRKLEDKVEQQKIDFSRFLIQNEMESNPVLMGNDVVMVPRMSMDKKTGQIVTVIGRVLNPGPYEIEIPLPLIDVIVMAGGFLEDSNLQSISILRRSEADGEKYRQVNIEDILKGKSDLYSQDYAISPGDIVHVSSTRPVTGLSFYVNIVGQIAKPGAYEIVEGTRLIDVMFAAGGPSENASIDNIALINSRQGTSAISLISLRDYLLNGDLDANPILREGDTVVIPVNESAKLIPPVQTAYSPSIPVNVIGEVKNPGAYQISADSTLLDIVVLAGGPTSNARLEQTMVIRGIKSDAKEQFDVDLQKVMTEGRLDLLPTILSGDTVFLPKIKEKREWWRSSISLARDISTLIVLYLYISRL